MNLIQRFYNNFKIYSRNTAFVSDDRNLTYDQFFSLINGSRMLLENQPEFAPQKAVGVLCNELAETYAAVFAIWFSGCVFIPLNPSLPPLANNELIRKHEIDFIFSSGKLPAGLDLKSTKILYNNQLVSTSILSLYNLGLDQVLYVLNTSGSTGIPKNVPINLKNVTAFVEGFLNLYPELTDADNFLQTYELTADAAFTGYLIPFLIGATVYSVPGGTFKPFAVAKMMAEKPITWVQVTPSLLACLHPFFHSFNLTKIKHFHFGGEALPADMVEEWRRHIPNAEISNVYGPTETTITATIYKCRPGEAVKEKNNVVSIGKPLKNVVIYIQKDENSEIGELLITGEHVMEKYLFIDDQPFKIIAPGTDVYYPTGDLVMKDEDGYLYFCGRFDEQVKISGYRVDLIEIENKIRSLLPKPVNVAAAAIEKSPGINQLVVFIENYSGSGKEIIEKLLPVFPTYKIPEKIVGVEHFPLSPSGKTDKKALVYNFKNSSVG